MRAIAVLEVCKALMRVVRGRGGANEYMILEVFGRVCFVEEEQSDLYP